jgi:hypothetical protein
LEYRGYRIVTGKGAATSLKLLVIICVLIFTASCSGSSSNSGKAAGKNQQAKAVTAAPAAKTAQPFPSADWISFGLDKDGSRIYYEKKSVQLPKERKTVGFWLLVTPVATSKVFTETQERLKKEEKDYQSLVSIKMLCEANCSTMTYDTSKTAMLKGDGTAILEQEARVSDHKPSLEVKTLIEKLCAGTSPGPLPKGSAQSAQATCEKAGVMVLIQPHEAVAAGAKWRLEGGEWKNSGEKVCNLPVDVKSQKGTYKIEYKEIPDSQFVTPEIHTAIVSGETSYSFYNTEYQPKATGQKR